MQYLTLISCFALICPWPDLALRVAWRQISGKKNTKKYMPKKMPQTVKTLLVSKKIQHYNGRKMDFPKITHEHQIAQNS
jgi:hypothetical protein